MRRHHQIIFLFFFVNIVKIVNRQLSRYRQPIVNIVNRQAIVKVSSIVNRQARGPGSLMSKKVDKAT